MTRLAVPILILLLMLFAGAVWLLVVYLDLPQMAGRPPGETTPSISEQQSPGPNGEAPRAASPAGGEASFDVARIDPQGTSVFAGQAQPGATVTIMGDGQAIGTAEADENGEWTFATEHPFANADPKLALSVKSAAETEAEKVAQAKVAGSLESRETAKEAPKGQTAGTVSSQLLKEFEGVVAAARTAAKEKEAQEAKAKEEKEDGKSEEVKESKEMAAAPAATSPPAAAPPAAAPPVAAPPAASPPVASPAGPPPAVALNEPQQNKAAPMRLSATPPEVPTARKTIPVPITFIYNEANFTDNGRKAAALLLEYLQLKHYPSVSLTGHADERGSPEFNMDLSRERLDAVAQFLKEGGYKGELELIPKGESEPFAGVVRSQYSRDDVFQFDRRVELIIAP
jgi:outer membrane protein OmpA-like peptidoglycan-associated protein